MYNISSSACTCCKCTWCWYLKVGIRQGQISGTTPCIKCHKQFTQKVWRDKSRDVVRFWEICDCSNLHMVCASKTVTSTWVLVWPTVYIKLSFELDLTSYLLLYLHILEYMILLAVFLVFCDKKYKYKQP